jgi:predicted RNA binding protein YcfA (HicA-like mRNA interferase family)
MPKIPRISSKELIRRLAALGYKPCRQRGSHIRLECPTRRNLTVPQTTEIGPGLFRKIMRDAELTPEECIRLLTSRK